jgi:hypothetical protein
MSQRTADRPSTVCVACGYTFELPPTPTPFYPAHIVPDPRQTPNACFYESNDPENIGWWCRRSGTIIPTPPPRRADAPHAQGNLARKARKPRRTRTRR